MVKLTTFFYISMTYFTHKFRRSDNTLTSFINEKNQIPQLQNEDRTHFKNKSKRHLVDYTFKYFI